MLESGDVESLKNLLNEHLKFATETGDGGPTLLMRLVDWPGNRPNSAAAGPTLLDAGAKVDARRIEENGTPLSGALCTEIVVVIRVWLAVRKRLVDGEAANYRAMGLA